MPTSFLARIDRGLVAWLGRAKPTARQWVGPALAQAAGPWCRRCGQSVRVDLDCIHCLGPPGPCAAVIRLGAYQGPLAECIRSLKYQCWWELASVLGDRLGQQARAELGGAWCRGAVVVPVPMPILRRYQRGLDHADLLARAVARHCGSCVLRGLSRRGGRPQAGSSRTARFRSSSRGWRMHSRAARRLACRHVLLVDDVLTTGRTAEIAAGFLQRAGAESVVLAVVAVTDLDGLWGSKDRADPPSEP